MRNAGSNPLGWDRAADIRRQRDKLWDKQGVRSRVHGHTRPKPTSFESLKQEVFKEHPEVRELYEVEKASESE